MIFLVLLLGLCVRLINLSQSLWWDEAISTVYANSLSFYDFINHYSIADFHPPGYFIILWVWGHLFGFSEISVRLPSVILGLATIFIIYLIGKELFSKRVGVLAALFLSLAPLHIYYSQEARMYSFAAFAATLSMFFLIRLIRGLKYSLIGLSISTTLVLYSDYVTYFILLPEILYIFIFQRKVLKNYLISLVMGCLPALLILPIFYQQFQVGIIKSKSLQGWGNVVGGANIKNAILLVIKILVGRVSFNNKIIYGLIVGLISLPYLFIALKLKEIFKKNSVIIILWLVIPPLCAFLLSFYIPIFNYSRLIFILPAFYLIISLGLSYFKQQLFLILTGTIIGIEILMSSLYLFDAKFQREDWRRAVNFVENNLSENDMVLFEYDSIPAPYIYYSHNLNNVSRGLLGAPAKTIHYLVDLESLVQDKRRFFLFEYLKDITDPNQFIGKRLEELGFINRETYNFRGVGFIKIYESKN